MMKNRTYRNVMILANRIEKKGYSLNEASEIAMHCFDEANPYGMGAEAIADRVISKE